MTDTGREEEGLLPCPFCGGEAKTYAGEYDFADVMVRCASCECEGPVFNEQDVTEDINRDAAIAHWNTRASGWRDIASAPKDSKALPEHLHRFVGRADG